MFMKCLHCLIPLKIIKKCILCRSPLSVGNVVKPLESLTSYLHKRINSKGQPYTYEEYSEFYHSINICDLHRICSGEIHQTVKSVKMPLKVPQTLNKKKVFILSNIHINVKSVEKVLSFIPYCTPKKPHLNLCKWTVYGQLFS